MRGSRGQTRLAAVLLGTLLAAGMLGAVALTRSTARTPGNDINPRLLGVPGPGVHRATGAAVTQSVGGSGTGFSHVGLPGSAIVTGEPSLALDPDGAIYVTGPTSIPHDPSISGSPLWKSTDGGLHFTGPVATGTAGLTAAEFGGGDSDLVFDSNGVLYLVSLWLGNSQIAVSTDKGASFVAQPLAHVTPVDDRPWITHDPVTDSLYLVWDGGDGLHVGRTLLRDKTAGTPAHEVGSLLFAQDVVAVPETPVGGSAVPDGGGITRQCVCAPGTIAVDPAGNVFIAYSSQLGMAVATSRDQGLTWTQSVVPHTATGSAFDLGYVFQTIRSDGDGNLYLTWSQGPAEGPIHVYFSYLPSGASTWHEPIRVSTTKNAVFGTLATFPNRSNAVDIAYYGTDDFVGQPNTASESTRWNLYLAQSLDPLGGGPFVTKVALPAVHDGAIETGGLGGAADRSLGDFFGLVVDPNGLADIVTAVGNVESGTTIQFVHQETAASMSAQPAMSVTKAKKTYGPRGESRSGRTYQAPVQKTPRSAGTPSASEAPPQRTAPTPMPSSRPFAGAARIASVPDAKPGPSVLVPLVVLTAFFALGSLLSRHVGRR
jgi:hypothetical protein